MASAEPGEGAFPTIAPLGGPATGALPAITVPVLEVRAASQDKGGAVGLNPYAVVVVFNSPREGQAWCQ